MVVYLSRGQNDAEVSIHFPAEPDTVWPIITRLDECSISAEPIKIAGVFCPISNLMQYIACADLEQEADIQKLNVLSGMIDGMNCEEHRIFSGALDAESVNGLDDVLQIAGRIGQYEFIEGVTSNKALGGWLVEHGLAGVDFPEAVRPYLDYAGIGAAYYASHGGAYTPSGYVKRQETVQEQTVEEKPRFALTLMSASGACRLSLPADDEQMEQARQALKVKSLGGVIFGDIKIDYPWAHLLPLDSITLDDANTLARYARQMTGNELRLYGAALDAEEPATFSDAVCIAENLDNYELVDGSEEEYGREALRYAGAGDEILDILDGFTDFCVLGRFEMEQDGVREIGYGQIKRLSSPFPRQAEQDQTMY